jgi:hypothetical protein
MDKIITDAKYAILMGTKLSFLFDQATDAVRLRDNLVEQGNQAEVVELRIVRSEDGNNTKRNN